MIIRLNGIQSVEGLKWACSVGRSRAFCYNGKVDIIPDKVIRSQLARSTCPPGFSSNVKICIAVYIILVIFVLFLLVMHIWVNLKVLKI